VKILLYVLIGLGIGGVSGTLGIGGGVLLVPVLIWLDFEYRQAAGITLSVLAVPVVLPAVWRYYSLNLISVQDLVVAGWIGLGFACGSLSGASVVPYLPVNVLRFLFGLMLIYVAVRFLLGSDPKHEAALTAAGLAAVALAWLGYLGLRLLGRKHLQRPAPLGDQVRKMQEEGVGGGDYCI
jgi:uncharacterized membrane protein YfcA